MKKVMKKIFVFFMAAVFALSLTACGNGNEGGEGVTDDSPVTITVANWSSAGAALERAGVECFSNAFT